MYRIIYAISILNQIYGYAWCNEPIPPSLRRPFAHFHMTSTYSCTMHTQNMPFIEHNKRYGNRWWRWQRRWFSTTVCPCFCERLVAVILILNWKRPFSQLSKQKLKYSANEHLWPACEYASVSCRVIVYNCHRNRSSTYSLFCIRHDCSQNIKIYSKEMRPAEWTGTQITKTGDVTCSCNKKKTERCITATGTIIATMHARMAVEVVARASRLLMVDEKVLESDNWGDKPISRHYNEQQDTFFNHFF